MTSNQLAYAANKIDQQIADETKRHNVVSEEELSRHNKTTEDLTTTANEIERIKAEETQRHNAKMESIQHDYNNAYLALQKAQGDEKLRIQQQLANIEADRAAEVSRHNIESENISSRINDINDRLAEETNRHNEAMETNAINLTNLETRKTNVQEKLAIAQNMYWNGVLANDAVKIANTNYASLANVLVDMYGLQQRMREWNTTKKNVESQTFKNYITGATAVMEGLSKSIASTLGVLQIAK